MDEARRGRLASSADPLRIIALPRRKQPVLVREHDPHTGDSLGVAPASDGPIEPEHGHCHRAAFGRLGADIAAVDQRPVDGVVHDPGDEVIVRVVRVELPRWGAFLIDRRSQAIALRSRKRRHIACAAGVERQGAGGDDDSVGGIRIEDPIDLTRERSVGNVHRGREHVEVRDTVEVAMHVAARDVECNRREESAGELHGTPQTFARSAGCTIVGVISSRMRPKGRRRVEGAMESATATARAGWRWLVRAHVVLLLACGPPPPTALPVAKAEVASSVPRKADSDLRAPQGDHVILRRLPCAFDCSHYTVTVFETGHVAWEGIAFVTVKGRRIAAIDPAAARALIDEAAALDHPKLPDKRIACAHDAPAVSVTVVRGDVRDESFVDFSCIMQICDDAGHCEDLCGADRLAEDGYTASAMKALDAFADRVDRAIPTTPWADDPQCRELRPHVLTASTGGSDGFIAEVEAKLRAAVLEDVLRELRATPKARVLLRTGVSDAHAAEAARVAADLRARGVDRGRIRVVEVDLARAYGEIRLETAIFVARSKCFDALEERWKRWL